MAEKAHHELDARSLRALAHPLRVRLLGLLRAEGPTTASILADRVGERSGTTSWHLRQLAEHGFIEQDRQRGNRRERWWRAARESTSVAPERFTGDPELHGPLETLLREFAPSTTGRARSSWPPCTNGHRNGCGPARCPTGSCR